ncbi:MAG: hypothetical protein QOK48_1781, partial [Blastocatellia bacterium]|nr:hypothetical protein [Blastocatellia bacterium]
PQRRLELFAIIGTPLFEAWHA